MQKHPGTRAGFGPCLRLGLLAMALGAGAASADDYTPVNELLRNGRFAEARPKPTSTWQKIRATRKCVFSKA